MPMPAGNVRVYQADSRGSLQFVGEDRIDYTRQDESLKFLKMSSANEADDFQKITSGTDEVAYDITLRNHKATPSPSKSTNRLVQHGGCFNPHEWGEHILPGRAVQVL